MQRGHYYIGFVVGNDNTAVNDLDSTSVIDEEKKYEIYLFIYINIYLDKSKS